MPDTSTEVAIATTTLSSAASTITFSSIGAGYTDLRIVLVGTTTASVVPNMYFNSDTGSNYSITVLAGDGASAFADRLTNQTAIWIADTISTSTTNPIMLTADIFSYAGSTNKTVLCTGSADMNGSGGVERSVGLWRSTSAITSVTLNARTTTWKIGTTATLYGIL